MIGAPGILSASVGLEDSAGAVGFAPIGPLNTHTFAEFPPSGTRVCFLPGANLLCGDCNGDMNVAITDALLGAQHGVGLITLTGTDFLQCNVNGTLGAGGSVDVLDALEIARFGVGLLVTLSCSP